MPGAEDMVEQSWRIENVILCIVLARRGGGMRNIRYIFLILQVGITLRMPRYCSENAMKIVARNQNDP